MWWIVGLWIALCGLGLPTAALSQDHIQADLRDLNQRLEAQARELADTRARNEELEQRLQALEKRSSGSLHAGTSARAPEPSEASALLEAQMAAQAAQQQSLFERVIRSTSINGYIELEFEDFDDSDSSFDAKSIDLLVTAQPVERLTFSAEIEFERVAKTSGDGDSRQGDVEVEQAWIQYNLFAWLQPRVGAVMVPFGRYNLEHFSIQQDLTDRPIMMRRVVPTTWAEAGAGFNGFLSLGDMGDYGQAIGLDYQVYAINGLSDRITDTSLRNSRGAFGRDSNDNKAFVGRAAASFGSIAEVGISGYTGKYDDDSDKSINGFATDLLLQLGSFKARGEYAVFDLDEGLNSDGEAVPTDAQGAYAELAYTFWPSVLDTLAQEFFVDPSLTAVARWGFAEIEDGGDADAGVDNREERWTFGINLRPVDQLAFKLEWQENQTDAESLERGDRDGFIGSVTGAF